MLPAQHVVAWSYVFPLSLQIVLQSYSSSIVTSLPLSLQIVLQFAKLLKFNSPLSLQIVLQSYSSSIATSLSHTHTHTHAHAHTHQQGQNWIERVRRCLMNKINSHTHLWTPPLLPLSCDDIATSAFNSHSGCYVESGVCTSVVTNCNSFLRVVSILDFSDLVASTKVGFQISAKQVSLVLSDSVIAWGGGHTPFNVRYLRSI